MATKEEMQTEFNIFMDIWELFKKYYNASQDIDYWEQLMREGSAINSKYRCTLCKDLVMLVFGELDRKARLCSSGNSQQTKQNS